MGKSLRLRSTSMIEQLESRQLLAGNGLSGQYFNNSDFTGTSVKRIDATVNFEWGAGAPIAGIGADTFSVRWTGQVAIETSGKYTFYTRANDGARLWVNGALITNTWSSGTLTEGLGSVELQAGTKYSLKMEFREDDGNATAQLLWSATGISKRVIPTGRLFNDAPSTSTRPASPTGLVAKATSPRRVELSWSDVAGETGYRVERRLDGTTEWRQVGTTAANAAKFVDETVEPAKTYLYRVRAFNTAGNSEPSNTAVVTTPRVEESDTPAAPRELQVTETGNKFARLKWIDVVGETGYKIERRLDGNAAWSQVGTTAANVTIYLDNDPALVAGKTYIYRVRAFNGAQNSAYSNTAVARIPSETDRPAAPRELRVTSVTTESVALAWVDVARETGYEIQRRLDGSSVSTYAKIGQTGENVTTFVDDDVEAGKVYIYRVIAFNGAGRSEPSNTTFAKIPGGTDKPAAPRELRVTSVSQNAVSLAWIDVTSETGYEVQRRLDGSSVSTYAKIGQTGANVTTFVDDDVEIGKVYIYRVIAFNGAGRSEPSNTTFAKIPGGLEKPAAPRELRVTGVTARTVSLAWADVIGEAGYEIQRRIDGAAAGFAKVGQTVANKTTFVDDHELQAGRTYIYRVIAFNEAGRSAPSNTAVATMPTSPVVPV